MSLKFLLQTLFVYEFTKKTLNTENNSLEIQFLRSVNNHGWSTTIEKLWKCFPLIGFFFSCLTTLFYVWCWSREWEKENVYTGSRCWAAATQFTQKSCNFFSFAFVFVFVIVVSFNIFVRHRLIQFSTESYQLEVQKIAMWQSYQQLFQINRLFISNFSSFTTYLQFTRDCRMEKFMKMGKFHQNIGWLLIFHVIFFNSLNSSHYHSLIHYCYQV